MKYLDRFKARMALLKQAYEGEEEHVPKRHAALVKMGVQPAATPTVSMLVDFVLACKMKGLDDYALFTDAQTFAEMEWELAQEVVAEARQSASVAA